MTEYSRAPEVEEIARKLIAETEDHQDLISARIEYVWRDKATVSKGRVTWATARKIGGLNAFLLNAAEVDVDDWEANHPLYVIEVAADIWRWIDDKQRIALVDHELCHLHVEFDDDGRPKLGMRGHDVEEFSSIVKRHGLWKRDVAMFAGHISEQLTLNLPTREFGEDDL